MLVEYVIEVFLLTVVGCLGIIGNCWLLGMFARLQAKLNFHKLMMTLAVYDNLYIVLCMMIFSLPEIVEDYKKLGYHFYIAPKALAVMQISLTGSVYCTVCISIERYLTVCHPFYISAKHWSSKRYIIPIIIFSVLYNVSRFFELRTEYDGSQEKDIQILQNLQNIDGPHNTLNVKNITHLDNVTNKYPDVLSESGRISSDDLPQIVNEEQNSQKYNYSMELTVMRMNKYYYSIYIIGLNFVVHGLIPFVIIITLNTLTYIELKEIESKPSFKARNSTVTLTLERRQRFRENETQRTNSNSEIRSFKIKRTELVLARVSLVIVLVMVICHSIRWIPNIYELIQRISTEDKKIKWPFWVESYTQVSHLFIVFNSSVNFYVYVITHYRVSSIAYVARNPSILINQVPEQ